MNNFGFFLVALSFLLTHEMDAVRRQEWNVFPLLSRLNNDQYGYMLFTIIHVPLYLLLFWGLFSPDGAINQAVVTGFDVFCLVHVVLHLLFVRHPRYRFNNWFSWTLILGAGLAGGADLLLRL